MRGKEIRGGEGLGCVCVVVVGGVNKGGCTSQKGHLRVPPNALIHAR